MRLYRAGFRVLVQQEEPREFRRDAVAEPRDRTLQPVEGIGGACTLLRGLLNFELNGDGESALYAVLNAVQIAQQRCFRLPRATINRVKNGRA